MARKVRIEIEGGLYHVITRGNDRQTVFHSNEDHKKFPALLAAIKERPPFFLYAFCLMSNRVHRLIEREQIPSDRSCTDCSPAVAFPPNSAEPFCTLSNGCVSWLT